jgi:hypothetical protein
MSPSGFTQGPASRTSLEAGALARVGGENGQRFEPHPPDDCGGSQRAEPPLLGYVACRIRCRQESGGERPSDMQVWKCVTTPTGVC